MLYLIAHSFFNGQSKYSNFFPLPELHETQFKKNRGALGTRMILSPMDMLVRKRSREICCPRQPERQLAQMFTLVRNKFDMLARDLFVSCTTTDSVKIIMHNMYLYTECRRHTGKYCA